MLSTQPGLANYYGPFGFCKIQILSLPTQACVELVKIWQPCSALSLRTNNKHLIVKKGNLTDNKKEFTFTCYAPDGSV